MHTQSDYPPANPGDAGPYTIDFINDLPSGVLITSASVALTVLQGTDSDPSSHLVGSTPSQIQGTFVTQLLRGLVAGNTYVLTMVAVGSDGNSYELYAYIPCQAIGIQ